MKYRIFADVSADIDLKYIGEDSISFIPMEYSLGEEMKTCDRPEDRDALKVFYDGQRHGDLTKTSQISPFLYEQYVEETLKEGCSVLYLALSSGLSSTYQSALMAQEELKEKYPDVDFLPFDTKAATAASNILVERAVRNQQKGMSLEENYNDLCEARERVCAWFLVPDLMYLRRGGRISGATAVIGTALNITPILRIAPDGTLENFMKKRGTKGAMNAILELFETHFDPTATEDPVYVVDADAPELGDYLETTLLEKHPGITVHRCVLTPIIGAHTGPGLAAICHMGSNEV